MQQDEACQSTGWDLLSYRSTEQLPPGLPIGTKPLITSPDNPNPKDLIGVKKCPLRFVPPALALVAAPACGNGAGKYGAFNWRANPVLYTVYLEATLRHLYALMDGEDNAQDSGIHHLSHIAANIAIIADCMGLGNLIDDRPQPGPAAKMLAEQDKSRG